MGAVWSARNELTDREFALKLMLPGKRDERRVRRFLQEAKAAGRLRHRSIVDVYDLGRLDDDTPYLVMELLEGEPLDALLSRVGKLPLGTALRIVADVAHALSVAHEQGIVHRDLKPANLFLHRDLEAVIVPKVLDFGVSKLLDGSFDAVETTIGTVLGSPAYMSPEQTRGEPDIDARADVWALGVILHKCITGRHPFRAPTYTSLLAAIQEDPAPEIRDVSPALSSLVLRCLEKPREDRVRSARELALSLEAILACEKLPMLHLSQEVPRRALSNAPSEAASQHTAVLVEEPAGTSSSAHASGAMAVAQAVTRAEHESVTLVTARPMLPLDSVPVRLSDRSFRVAPSVRPSLAPTGDVGATGMHASIELAPSTGLHRRSRSLFLGFAAATLGIIVTVVFSSSPRASSAFGALPFAPPPKTTDVAVPFASEVIDLTDAPTTLVAPSDTIAPSVAPVVSPARPSNGKPKKRPPRPKVAGVNGVNVAVPKSTPSTEAHEGVVRAGF